MINLDHLKQAMDESHIQPEIVYQLLKQGIEVERLRLQFNEANGSATLDSFVKIMQGERFLSLLIAARFR